MNTADNIDINTFEFPIFRLKNILYSIPVSALLLWGFVSIIPLIDQWMLANNPLLKLPCMLLSLGAFAFILLKTIFYIHVRKTIIYLNEQGFWFNSLQGQAIAWEDVRYVAFSRDKYERQSNSSSSSVFFSLGSMKTLHINCSTWTIMDKAKRNRYNQDFQAFKAVLRNYCQVHDRFRN